MNPQSVDDDRWDQIVDLALKHGLACMLFGVLKEVGLKLKSDVPMETLIHAASRTAAKNVLFEMAFTKFIAASRDVGIPTIWLKGFALAYTVYPQPWMRPMRDLDVLVPYNQRDLALSTARTLGFHFLDKDPGKLNIEIPVELQHHYELYGGATNSVCLEIHFRLLGSIGLELLPWEQLNWFWENTSTSSVKGDVFTLLNPEAHLLYICAHALLQHGEAIMPLIAYFDTHLLITENELDWQIIVDKAIDLKWSYAVERVLRLAIKYFNTPVPAWVLDQLRTRRSTEEDTFRAVKFQKKGNRLERRLMLLSKLSFQDRLRIISKLLFPPKKHMQQQYSITPGNPVLPYYFYRWFDAGCDVVWSLRNRLWRFFQRN
jgi:hypothetical protein